MDTSPSAGEAHYPGAGGGEMNYTGTPGQRAESRSQSEEERERAEVTTLPTRIKQNVIKPQGEQLICILTRYQLLCLSI